MVDDGGGLGGSVGGHDGVGVGCVGIVCGVNGVGGGGVLDLSHLSV